MEEKRKKMMLISKNMPDDVYEILDEKAKKRNLTQYVVELVENQNRDQELIRKLLTKLDRIESTLEQIKGNPAVITPQSVVDSEIDAVDNEEIILTEGKLVEAATIKGDVDENDTDEEPDF